MPMFLTTFLDAITKPEGYSLKGLTFSSAAAESKEQKLQKEYNVLIKRTIIAGTSVFVIYAKKKAKDSLNA